MGYKTRFYLDELNDFCARMQWADEGRGNRNPKVVVNGEEGIAPIHIDAKAGDRVLLDASKSRDPDGDGLTFHWWQQTEIGKTAVDIKGADQSVSTIFIPSDAKDDTIHVLCEVHDDGPFHLVAYKRIIIKL